MTTTRPWAWRRILDGLPAGPCPAPVVRPGRPFTLRIATPDGPIHAHSPLDPVGEAADLVPRRRLARAQTIVVLGFGAGYLVERALAAAPIGCVVIAAIVDPGSFLLTLHHRPLAATIANPRLALAVGDCAEISAALPARDGGLLWLVHPPVLAAASPVFTFLIERVAFEHGSRCQALSPGGRAQSATASPFAETGRLSDEEEA